MTLNKIYAQLNCTDIERSAAWFERLFGRAPDASPMDGLKEWHHEAHAGFQLFANDADAGHGCLTLIVTGLEAERRRLVDAGLKIETVRSGDVASVFQLSDPDGNVVVFAEPVS